jgi:hypothetical protein
VGPSAPTSLPSSTVTRSSSRHLRATSADPSQGPARSTSARSNDGGGEGRRSSPPTAAVSPDKSLREAPCCAGIYFAEFFAGSAGLTQTLRRLGVTCREADDLATGGTDFSDPAAVAVVKLEPRGLRCEGWKLALHFATPCNSFSRARDRSEATQLRSADFPEGLPDLDAGQVLVVTKANDIALITFDTAIWAARDLCAVVTSENPATSYLWLLLAKRRPQAKFTWTDMNISQCLFGAPYRKDGPRPFEGRIRAAKSETRSSLRRSWTLGHYSQMLEHRALLATRTTVYSCAEQEHVRQGNPRRLGIRGVPDRPISDIPSPPLRVHRGHADRRRPENRFRGGSKAHRCSGGRGAGHQAHTQRVD